MTYTPDKQRLEGWQWAAEKANAASGETLTVDQYIVARMNDVADSYNAQRLAESREEPERKALIDKLVMLEKSKLADVEAAIDAASD
jgi:hypothetical protein